MIAMLAKINKIVREHDIKAFSHESKKPLEILNKINTSRIGNMHMSIHMLIVATKYIITVLATAIIMKSIAKYKTMM
jgi:hypothetical protein